MEKNKDDTTLDQKILEIRKTVQEELNAPGDYCTNKTRKREYADARHILCYVLHKTYKRLPFTKLGRETGDRDHASAINSIKIIENLIETDKEKRIQVNTILLRCKEIKGEVKISLFDMGLTVIYNFFNTGRYDAVESDGENNYYIISLDKYIWNTDSVVNELIQYFSQKSINIKFRRNLTGPNYRILMFNEKIFE
jgi:hypothetical protein